MKKILASIGCLAYLAMGFVQIFATIAWFKVCWEWDDLFAILGAIVASFIPVLGTVTGILGATDGWEWPMSKALLFFCWPCLIYILVIFFGKLGNLFHRPKR